MHGPVQPVKIQTRPVCQISDFQVQHGLRAAQPVQSSGGVTDGAQLRCAYIGRAGRHNADDVELTWVDHVYVSR